MELRQRKIISLTTVVVLLGSVSMSASSKLSGSLDVDAIYERMKPVGSVAVDGQSAKQTAAKRRQTPEKIYQTYCAACHESGMAGAPILGDKAAWGARLAEQGMDMLVTNAIKGINAMPAKGTCMKCDDEDIRNTVKYMVDASS